MGLLTLLLLACIVVPLTVVFVHPGVLVLFVFLSPFLASWAARLDS